MRNFINLFLFLAFTYPAGLLAQEIEVKVPDLDQTIPVNPEVRIGQLENGLTYMIRKNQKPEKRVELRLVVKAGSILEDESQLGLAHFVEHMAFNGSKNFEKNELVDYLQSVGVQFGADLNAYTSFDETVYMLPIPTDDPEIVDKGLLVLEDWASGVSFTDEEIEKERGVVIEEWRTGRGANQRMLQKWLPVALKNSHYADRLPIGTKESLENFSNDDVRRFYRDWYRPDLMAVIAVGDIDVDEMEQEIKERFSKLQNPDNARERKMYAVPDHEETFVVVTSDPEASYTQVQLIYKHDEIKMTTLNDFRGYMVRSLYNGMLGMRLSELTQVADPPFTFGSTNYGGYIGPKDSYSSFAVVSNDKIKSALEILITENERVLQHGFTGNELERYKLNMLNAYERRYNERDKTQSWGLVSELIRAFTVDEPIPGAEFEYEFVKQVIPSIELEEINKLAKGWIRDDNTVIIVTANQKEGETLPTEDEIRQVYENTKGKVVVPYAEEEIAASLLKEIPTPGKVVESREIEELGITEWKLGNGVTVALKPTNFKNDEVMFSGFSHGGTSLYPLEDLESAQNAAGIMNESGVADFSPTDLSKYLSGKTAYAGLGIGTFAQSASGSASPKDMETMFEILYARFTDPRKDSEAFESYKNKTNMMWGNMMSNPDFWYINQLQKDQYNDHPRLGGFPTPEKLEKIDFERAWEIYNERFSDASGFTFTFVGNFTLDEIKPLVEKYIGGLPSSGRNETWIDPGYRKINGNNKIYYKGKDEKSKVTLEFAGENEWTHESSYVISSLASALSIRLTEVLREEISGVYGTRASGSAFTFPSQGYSFTISFDCAPENVDILIDASLAQIKDFQDNGVPDELVIKVKEQQRRNREEQLKENRFWLSTIQNYYYFDRDMSKFGEFDGRVEGLTGKALQKAANKYLNTDEYSRYILMPEKEGED